MASVCVRFLFGSALALIGGCTQQDHTEPTGTYVGEGTVTWMKKGGTSQTFTTPKDEIIVTTPRRNYQVVEIAVVARECAVRTESGTGGTTSWPLFTGNGSTCTFDVPSVGKVNAKLSGGLQRRPGSQSAKVTSVYLSLSGDTAEGDTVRYTIEAKPEK